MATPPYGRRAKKNKAAKPKRTLKQMPSASAIEHANVNARFKRTSSPSSRPRGKAKPKTNAKPAGAGARFGGKRTGSVTTGMVPGSVKPIASSTATPKTARGARFTSNAGSKPARGGRFGKIATANVGADTAPKSPRPVPGSKGPNPSAQAIAHASPNARFKRSTGTTAPAPSGLGGRVKKVKPPKPAGGRFGRKGG